MHGLPRTSKRDAQLEFGLMFLIVAALFWASAQSESFTMPVEVYGEAVIAIPAELWSGVLLFASATHLYGLSINGRWRWSPFLRLVGISTHIVFSVVFIWASLSAPQGDVVTLFSIGFLWVHTRFFIVNVKDARAALRG